MPNVVETLVVELDGRVAKLESVLTQGKGKLDDFQRHAERTGVGAAKGGDAIAERYARGGREISLVGESLARSGEAAGGHVKKLLAVGGDVVGMFGPQGALI